MKEHVYKVLPLEGRASWGGFVGKEVKWSTLFKQHTSVVFKNLWGEKLLILL